MIFFLKWVIIDCKKRGDIMDIYKRIYELENEIASLPQGSINMKKIYGKEQPYLQWTENGKSKSKYIKKNEREEVFAGVERRKQLQEELKELKQHSSIVPPKSTDFETSVIIGERLLALTKGVKNWGKRDCFRQLQAYLNSEETDRVCLVFGLRRTGKTTMLRIADILIDFQRTFLETGKDMKPLRQKDVAQIMEVHESTVSRAVKGKYLQCGRGVYALSDFMPKGMEEVSGDSVKQMLKKFIQNEDKKKPLSDQKLVKKLEEEGVQISRRTVAKYRMQMEIPDASGRKAE